MAFLSVVTNLKKREHTIVLAGFLGDNLVNTMAKQGKESIDNIKLIENILYFF